MYASLCKNKFLWFVGFFNLNVLSCQLTRLRLLHVFSKELVKGKYSKYLKSALIVKDPMRIICND